MVCKNTKSDFRQKGDPFMQIKLVNFSKLMFILFMTLGFVQYFLSSQSYPSYTSRGGYIWVATIILFFLIRTFKNNSGNYLQKILDYAVILLLALYLIIGIF